MDTGQIQLGAKRSSGKSLDRYPTQGFFYGGSSVGRASGTPEVAGSTPARQHLILQTIYVGGGLVTGQSSGFDAEDRGALAETPRRLRTSASYAELVGSTTARRHLFYDNPTRKRLARCTNTIHTGATLQVWANEQRLRKGFHSACKPRRLVKESRPNARTVCRLG